MGTYTPLFYVTTNDWLVARLSRSFRNLCPGLVEDAAHHAWFEALRRGVVGEQRSECGRPEARVVAPLDETVIRYWLLKVAWRQLRGCLRRSCFRRETGAIDLSLVSAASPEDPGEELAVWQRLRELVPEAARRYGRRHQVALEMALYDRFLLGLSDLDAANAHDVPREYLNKSKNWIVGRLFQSADEPEVRAA